MKTRFRTKIMDSRGFSLLELLTVIAIISILLGVATIYGRQWMDKYNAESQMRTLHTELMATRARAMEKNRIHFIVLNDTGVYQVVEDTNDSGGNKPDAGDKILETDILKYLPKTSSTMTGYPVTFIMDARGLISSSAGELVNAVSIPFDTKTAMPAYDCLQLYATRINIGRMNGKNCDPR
jgi:prepilin-type N-terminal cleavage/methylation domain-containing protein